MKLILVRHGHYQDNSAEPSGGETKEDWKRIDSKGLSAIGRKQARQLMVKLVDEQIDYIYSSPLPRARETAEILAAGRSVQLDFWDELKEIPPLACPGAPAGHNCDEAGNYRRARAVEEKLRALHGQGDDTVLVVTHRNLMATLYSSLLGLGPCGYNRFSGFQNCGIYRLVLENPDKVQVIFC